MLNSQDCPEVFLIGAPKCGTTTIYDWLAKHPQMHCPRIKEPHFFSEDMPFGRNIDDASIYRRIYHGADSSTLRCDASATYLLSSIALEKIRQLRPSAKILVALREPVAAALSLFRHLRRNCEEENTSFEVAWKASGRPGAGEKNRNSIRFPPFHHYSIACDFGPQLDRLYRLFPNDQVCVIIFEDLLRGTEQELNKITDFLGISPSRLPLPCSNEASGIRWRPLQMFLRHPPPPIGYARKFLRRYNIVNPKITRFLYEFNKTPAGDEKISEEFMIDLEAWQKNCVKKVETFLGHTIISWHVSVERRFVVLRRGSIGSVR